MIKILISGIEGRMGAALRAAIGDERSGGAFEVVAGFDQNDGNIDGIPVFSRPEAGLPDLPCADVIIDFSHHDFVPNVLNYAIETKTPVVVATTALGAHEHALMGEAAKHTAVFHSANMSLGINLAAKMAQLAAPVIEDGFDIEILEAHHNQKKDAPSGTAILLADAINASLRDEKTYIYGRHGRDAKPDRAEMGIHAVRGGTITGIHTVMFAGADEVIEIRHTAYSRNVFASGALKAAAFIAGKEPGLYDMNSLIG